LTKINFTYSQAVGQANTMLSEPSVEYKTSDGQPVNEQNCRFSLAADGRLLIRD